MKTFLLHHRTVRVGLAVIVSLFIVLHGRWQEVLDALVAPSFYLAFGVSFSIALFLLWYVHSANRILDRYFPWDGIVADRLWARVAKLVFRCLLQLLVGVVIPATADLLLVGTYLNAIGEDMHTNGFLQFDFPVIVFFLVIMNGFYILVIGLLKEPKPQATPEPEPAENIMLLTHAGTCVQLQIDTDILYCCRIGKRVAIHTKDGNIYYSSDSLGNMHETYRGAGLILINRSTLFNVLVAQGYKRGLRRDTLQVIIKDEYLKIPTMDNQTLFVVTKEHIQTFKTYFN